MVTDSVFDSSFAEYEASVFNLDAGSLTLTNSIFRGNQAAGAGAIRAQDTSLTLTNVLFSGNLSGTGAAVELSGTTTGSLINITAAGNRNLSANGTISILSTGTVEIHNSVCWTNQNSGGTGTLNASISDAGNGAVSIFTSLVQGSGGSGTWTGGTLIDGGGNLDEDPLFHGPVDPLLTPTTDGNYRVGTGSGAVDSGNNAINSWPFDLDGDPRIQNLVIDMGPYEGEDVPVALLTLIVE